MLIFINYYDKMQLKGVDLMTREEYIKVLITDQGHSVKSFSNFIGLPYSTLRSILSGGVGGASVDNVIKICKGLGITVDTLNKCGDEDDGAISLSSKEREVIIAYRKNPSLQVAVDRLLGVEEITVKNEKRA